MTKPKNDEWHTCHKYGYRWRYLGSGYAMPRIEPFTEEEMKRCRWWGRQRWWMNILVVLVALCWAVFVAALLLMILWIA